MNLLLLLLSITCYQIGLGRYVLQLQFPPLEAVTAGTADINTLAHPG